MPSPFAKVLIDIAVGHLLPKKYAWVSEYEAGPFHVETGASAANGGNTFRALCGATGDFNHYYGPAQIISRLKCATCQELSTTGIQDVASQQEQPTKAVNHAAGERNLALMRPESNRDTQHTTIENSDCIDVADQGRGTAPLTESITVGDTGVSGVPDFRQRGQAASTASNGCVADSQVSLIERLIPKTLPDADLCHCGQPATLACPCGAQICPAHFYDGEGQHVEDQGFCADCVTLLQEQNASRYPDPATHPHFA